MDPQACLDKLFDLYTNGSCQSNELYETFDDLYNWLKNGGFPPVCQELPRTNAGYMMGVISIANKNFERIYSIDVQPDGSYSFIRSNEKGIVLDNFPLINLL